MSMSYLITFYGNYLYTYMLRVNKDASEKLLKHLSRYYTFK
jgi:hypothetical protein